MPEPSPPPVIVVGVDGSDLSTGAVRWALEQARATGGAVRAVMSWELPRSVLIYLSPTSTEGDYEAEAERVMDRVLADVAPDVGEVPLSRVMTGRTPGVALTEEAADAALLVVGGPGWESRPSRHLGSVASYCVHHSPCPVLVYRGRMPGPSAG